MRNKRFRDIQAVHFRQWTRNSWGLFRVLGKVVHIGVLLVAYLFAVEIASAQNQSQSNKITDLESDVNLEEIEVNGQRINVSKGELARIVTVITQSEIARSSYSSVAELLNQELSLDIRQRGPDGVQADISINGSSFEQVLILLNGIPLNNPQTGHFNGNIPISLEIIDHIEVISGGASRWLGPQAYAGAVNIVTRQQAIKETNIQVSGGAHKLHALEVSSQFGKQTTHLVNGTYLKHAGYTHNTDLSKQTVYYSAVHKNEKSTWKAQAIGGMKAYGAQAFYTPTYPDQYEETASMMASIGHQRKGKISFSTDAYYKMDFDEFHLFRNEAPEWYGGANKHQAQAAGMINNIWWFNDLGMSSVGLDIRYEGILSTVLGDQQIDDLNSADRSHVSLYIEQQYQDDQLTLVGGIMGNLRVSEELKGSLYPGLDLKYRLNQKWRLHFSGNRAMRYPSFTELYYSSPSSQGNRELEPEKGWHLNAGISHHSGGLIVHSGLYSSFSKNEIDWIRYPGQEYWQAKNIAQIQRSGARIDLKYSPFDQDKWKSAWFRFAYAYNWVSLAEQNFDSRYVLDHVRHKLISGVNLPIPIYEGVNLHMDLRWLDRAGSYIDWDENGTAYSQPYKAYLLIDAKIQFTIRNFLIWTAIQNIGDQQYADIGHVYQPGRWYRMGVNVKIKHK